MRSQPRRRVGPNTAPLQGLGLDLMLYKFVAPGPRFLKPHAKFNHMNSLAEQQAVHQGQPGGLGQAQAGPERAEAFAIRGEESAKGLSRSL